MLYYLGNFGYCVGLVGKVYVKLEFVFFFELIGGFDKNCVCDLM